MKKVLLFHTGHVSKLLMVNRRTIYNWLKQGKISGQKTPRNWWLFTLDEINRLRKLYLMEPLSPTEAEEFWNQW